MNLKNNNDYRNTDSCPILENIDIKKSDLERLVKREHPRVRIMYNEIKKKNGKYFKKLETLYNHKCAYCGIITILNDIRLFEVDHFICEASYEDSTSGRAEAGKVSNLIFSCYSCNRGKKGMILSGKYRNLLNPDDNSIAQVFFRDENYYIKIRDEFQDDSFIQKFYDDLSLGNEFRRLDYLLLEINSLSEKFKDDIDIYSKLNCIVHKLTGSRNNLFLNDRSRS